MESKIRLFDQMRHVMRLKHMSLLTEVAYVSWVRRFIRFHDKRHPGDIGAEEIRAFLTHLAVQGRVAASTQNGARSRRAQAGGGGGPPFEAASSPARPGAPETRARCAGGTGGITCIRTLS